MAKTNHTYHLHISKKRQLSYFDKITFVAAFLYPLSGLHQVIEVFNGNTEGVSIVSWLGFLGFSALFFAYSIFHKIKPMIVTYFLWVVVDILVVAGILFHQST